MLDEDWLSTCAPLGILDASCDQWKAIGAGVFVFDDPFIWYVTANHLIKEAGDESIFVLINHKKVQKSLVNINSLHQQHKLNWLIDEGNDLAATPFPADVDFALKAVSFPSFLTSNDMLPTMSCYSVGCPYSLAGFDIEKVNPFVLGGIISNLDRQAKKVYVTVPTFPGNSGGPLFVWKQPIKANGDVVLGNPVVYLGGVIIQYVVVASMTPPPTSQQACPPLHLGVVVPSEFIHDLLHNADAKKLKNKMQKSL